MKRLLLALVLGAVAALGFSGTASAGNCYAGEGYTYQVGSNPTYDRFSAVVYGCTGVDRVEFSNDASHGLGGSDDIAGYWWDGDLGQGFLSTNVLGTLVQTVTGTESHNVLYSRPLWCSSGQMLYHWMTTTYGFRIRSVIPPQGAVSWGPWHRRASAGYQGWC